MALAGTHQASGATEEAEATYRRAIEIDFRRVKVLAPLQGASAPTVARIVSESPVPTPETAPDEGPEAWLAREEKKRLKNQERNSIAFQLQGLWKRAKNGEAEAAAGLRRLAETVPAEHDNLRLAALGHLAVLHWQAGDREAAERYHRQIDEFLERSYNPVTQENYRKLRRELRDRSIQLVAVQYPMRPLEPLKQLVGLAPEVVFVDNEQTFKRALHGRPYAEIFRDLFAGDFGHLTPLGNRILAENVAEAILGLIPGTSEVSVRSR